MSRSCDPRWGGSAAGLTDFVIRAVAAFEPVKADALYLRIYWWASDLRYFRVLADSGVDCTRLIRGARIVVREYPDPWNFNHVAVLAGECGDQQAAREFVALIGDRPLPEVWGPGSRGEQNFRRLKDWTAR